MTGAQSEKAGLEGHPLDIIVVKPTPVRRCTSCTMRHQGVQRKGKAAYFSR